MASIIVVIALPILWAFKLLFHKGSFKKNVLKYGTPKPSPHLSTAVTNPGSSQGAPDPDILVLRVGFGLAQLQADARMPFAKKCPGTQSGILKSSWDLVGDVICKLVIRVTLVSVVVAPNITLLTKSLEPLSRVRSRSMRIDFDQVPRPAGSPLLERAAHTAVQSGRYHHPRPNHLPSKGFKVSLITRLDPKLASSNHAEIQKDCLQRWRVDGIGLRVSKRNPDPTRARIHRLIYMPCNNKKSLNQTPNP